MCCKSYFFVLFLLLQFFTDSIYGTKFCVNITDDETTFDPKNTKIAITNDALDTSFNGNSLVSVQYRKLRNETSFTMEVDNKNKYLTKRYLIPGGVFIGRTITLNAFIPIAANRWIVNLVCGGNMILEDDIALHVDFRYEENQVIVHSYRSNMWNSDRRVEPIVIHKGEQFTMKIVFKEDDVVVYLNDKFFTKYPMYLPHSRISHLVIERDAVIKELIFDTEKEIKPIQVVIPFGLVPGTVIKIGGKVLPNTNRFLINFACDSKNTDIALHISFRFDTKCVVMNDLQNKVWGNEETQIGVPITLDQSFQMEFTVQSDGIIINIFDEFYFKFFHRIPYHRITYINFEGGAQITSTTFSKPSSSSIDEESTISYGSVV